MGNIPMFQPRETRGGSPRMAQIADYSGDIRRSGTSLAKGLNAMAHTLSNIDNIHRIAQRQRTERGIDEQLRLAKEGWVTRRGSDASGISTEVTEYFDKLIPATLKGTKDARTEYELTEYLNAQKRSVSDWAFNHIVKETQNAINDADALTDAAASKSIGLLEIGDARGIEAVLDKAERAIAELHPNPEHVAIWREAATDKAWVEAYAKWRAEDYQTAAAAWRANRGDLKGKLSTEAYAKIAAAYEQDMQQVRVDNAISDVIATSSNPWEASQKMLKESVAKKYSLTPTQQIQASQRLAGVHQTQVAEADRVRRNNEKDAVGEVYKALFSDDGAVNVEAAHVVLDKMLVQGKISSDLKLQIQQNLNNAQWTVDATKWNRVMMQALTGESDTLDIMVEASMGDLGRDVTPLLSIARAVEEKKKKGNAVVNYLTTATKDFNDIQAAFAKTNVTNKLNLTETEFVELVRQEANELSGGTATAFDKAFQQAAVNVLSRLPKPVTVTPDTAIDQLAEVRNMYNDYARRLNKKGKKTTQPTETDVGVFTNKIFLITKQRYPNEEITKYDPRVLATAEEMLTQGLVLDGKFYPPGTDLPGWDVWQRGWGEQGALFSVDPTYQNTSLVGGDTRITRQQAQELVNDPSGLEGETPEEKAQTLNALIKADMTEEELAEVAEDIRASMETK